MLKETREISVLEQFENMLVVTGSGERNPLLVLNATAVAEIVILCRRANEALAAPGNLAASVELHALSSRVSEILQRYSSVQNKYFAGPDSAVEVDNVERELQALQVELQKFHGKD